LAVAELFFVLGSNVFEVTLALSVMVLPEGAVTLTTNVSVTFAPAAKLPNLHFTAPLLPGAGDVHDPAVMLTLLNVVPGSCEEIGRGESIELLRKRGISVDCTCE
jgi:hypothetical protein